MNSKTIIYFRWAKLIFKCTAAIILLTFCIKIGITAITAPFTVARQLKIKPVGDIEGYWFEMKYAMTNTIRYGNGAKIIHITPKKGGSYQVKYSLDDNILFDDLFFKNTDQLLYARVSSPFGGGRKFLFLKSSYALVFEGNLYIRMGKVAHVNKLLNITFLQVELLKEYPSRGLGREKQKNR